MIDDYCQIWVGFKDRGLSYTISNMPLPLLYSMSVTSQPTNVIIWRVARNLAGCLDPR
jgi:hypothetical protein